MKNVLIEFFKKRGKCSHKNALLTTNEGYCPDCGEYLVKKFYIIRCTHCEVKRLARLNWGEICPESRFCSNCGSESYYIEQLDNINFIDARYAICLKEVASKYKSLHCGFQVWVDNQDIVVKQLTG